MPHPSASTLLNRLTIRAKFRHLLVLVKLAELGSMRRAAQAVGMSQPAVSQLVADLEQLLETELFFRHAKGVEPTVVTNDLLPIAHRILDALGEGAETIANRLQKQGGIVRIDTSPAALGGLIQPMIQSFADKHPDIQVQVGQAANNDPLGGVSDGSADIVCTREPKILPEGWVFERCIGDELIAVCGQDHPFAKLGPISATKLGEAKWLQNRVGSIARKRFEELSAENDWPLSSRVQIIMHIPEQTKEMLMTGEYLTILPRSVALPWLKAGAVVELETEINRELPALGFLWQKDRAGDASKKFAQMLRQVHG